MNGAIHDQEILMPFVSGFLPSTSGWHFPNAFPSVPLLTARLPGIRVDIPLGNAAHGLCGGMVFGASDYFLAGLRPPADRTPPASGPVFQYLVRRLWDSWDVPGGLLRYLLLMNPKVPDSGGAVPFLGTLHLSRAAALADEWPKIRAELDNNRLAPLGLVRCKSEDPALIGQNHQVLAYGYEEDGQHVEVHVYDPNAPDRDDVILTANLAGPNQPCNIACTSASNVNSFFLSRYAPPPGALPLGTPMTS